MKERYLSKIAVFLILTRETENGTEMLLQRRYNTNYMDGFYDMSCSGHVEAGETMTQALVRETSEELGINIKESDLYLVHLLHSYKNDYVNVFFKVKEYVGTPRIMEPNKCDDLNWFNINNLPDNVIPKNRNVIECIKNNIMYDDDDFQYLKRN
jgi:mutator protein MutT